MIFSSSFYFILFFSVEGLVMLIGVTNFVNLSIWLLLDFESGTQ